MPAAYIYPRVRHRRSLTPGPFKRYQSYKPALRQEFSAVCVYCRTPDLSKGREGFGVDHYLPKRYFRALATNYSNLYYCCNRCNSLKKDYFPDAADKRSKRFIPNPCDHVMFDHLRFDGDLVRTRSEAGVFTEDLLKLNVDDLRTHRSLVQLAIKQLLKNRSGVEAQIRVLSRKLRGRDASRIVAIQAELAGANQRLAKLDDKLKELGSLP